MLSHVLTHLLVISRLQQVSVVAKDIQSLSQELSSVYEISLEPFTPFVYKLVSQFSDEFDKYQLDEIIVAAIAPLVRRMVANWNPLEDPSTFASTFRSWRRALRVTTTEDKPPLTVINVYGREVPAASDPERYVYVRVFTIYSPFSFFKPRIHDAFREPLMDHLVAKGTNRSEQRMVSRATPASHQAVRNLVLVPPGVHKRQHSRPTNSSKDSASNN